ncbi:hypothetical protein SNR37_003431 [Agarivorans aestuarii]|uniref:Secreted protein n=1 Tax=Agarivorans aestuarii TaxID=1563703 RepID=A0ABU7G3U4_9ALTE|nr:MULTISPECIES: hypothetical protein [Agarivorans]MEE1674003.1 hypothetical protein [Agarivorans aestuarii]
MMKMIFCLLPLSFAVSANCTLQGDVYQEGAQLGNLKCLDGNFTLISSDPEPTLITTTDLTERNGIHVEATEQQPTDNTQEK